MGALAIRSLKQLFFRSALLIVVGPLLLLTVLGYLSFGVYFRDIVLRRQDSGLEQAARLVDAGYREMTESYATLSVSKELSRMLERATNNDYSRRDQIRAEYIIQQLLRDTVARNRTIYNVVVSTPSRTISASSSWTLEDPFENAPWFLDIVAGDTNDIVVLPTQTIRNSEFRIPVVLVAGPIAGSTHLPERGVIIVMVAHSTFALPLDRLLDQSIDAVMLAHGHPLEKIYVARNTASEIEDSHLLSLAMEASPGIKRIEKRWYLTASTTTDASRWKVTAATPLSSLATNSWPFAVAVLVTATGAVSAMIVLLLALQRRLKISLFALMTELDNVSNGDFSYSEIPNKDGLLEFNAMFARLETTKDRLSTLISRVRHEERERSRLSIEAIAAKTNPHFLYNTLDSIRWSAFNAGDERTAEMVRRLSRLLRNTITPIVSDTLLKDEIEFVRNYWDVVSSRYEGRLELLISVDSVTLKKPTIPLVLQPLIENSLVHGAGTCGGKGVVTVEGRYDSGTGIMILRVTDVGSGEKWPVSGGTDGMLLYPGIGHASIVSRLRERFGESAELRMVKNGAETCVTITYPVGTSDPAGRYS